MSISGMEMRPGLRKRSKIRLLGSGSRLVMPLVYATIELAPEPRMFHQMSLLFGKARQIGHDQEVRVEAHLVDDFEFVVEALAHFGIVGALAIAQSQTFFALAAQFLIGRDAGGQIRRSGR